MKPFKLNSLIITFFCVFFNFTVIPFEQFAQHPTVAEPIQVLNQKEIQPVFDIDSRALRIAEEMGGGVYNHEIDAIVPLFPHLVRAEWLNYKNSILERIGPVYPLSNNEFNLWRNSATSINELVKDAQVIAPYFWGMCIHIANKTEAIASFGINDQYMIKSKKSIKRKVLRSIELGMLSEEEAISKMRDPLRGTIIVETPEQIPLVIQGIKDCAYKMDREVIFINIWEENRPSGYVGVHAKMLLPIYDAKGLDKNREIIVEIQIHLRCIMDGTKTCVKEREHLLYERVYQKNGVDPEIQAAASTLLYLTALKQCPPRL